MVALLISDAVGQAAGGGGSLLPTPNLDRTILVIIKAFLGAICGLVVGSVAFALERNQSFPQGKLRVVRAILFGIAVGLTNSLVFSLLELNNAIYGKPVFELNAFEERRIMITAIGEFVAGFLIGTSIAVVAQRLRRRVKE